MKKIIIILLVIAGFRVIVGDPKAPYHNRTDQKQNDRSTIDNTINRTLDQLRFKDNYKGDTK